MLARRNTLPLSIILAVVTLAISTPTLRAAEALEATATIQGDKDAGLISRHIYGQFAEHLGRCIYDGIWVGTDSKIPNTRGLRNDVVAALRDISIPNLRWPGGCFADDYHWRDGIGPPDKRPRDVNIHWGQVIETNAFGTHEFLDLCEQIGCEPYIAGNVGSGTPAEMRDWIEYMTFDGDSELANLRRANGRDKPWKVTFFGVGNENWGCGGNMTAEYYSDLFRRYATFCRDFSGNQLVRVACGPGSPDQHWNKVLMDRAHEHMQAYSIHYYTVWPTWRDKTSATGFGEKEWFYILRHCRGIDGFIRDAEEEMDRVDPDKKIRLSVDEWGSWYRPEPGHPGYGLYQQNSLRDAILAGLTFHIFQEHNDRVRMANIAQTVNVLQAMILTEGDRMLLTPTYYVFQMYKVHQDATRLPVKLNSPDYEYESQEIHALSVAASRAIDGAVNVSIVNAHATAPIKLACELEGVDATNVAGRILTADSLDAHNTFDAPNQIKPANFNGATIDGDNLTAEIPARSVVVLKLTK